MEAPEEGGGEAAAPVPPREAIATLIESYRQALETHDTSRLEQEVYQSAIPSADAEFYDIWFQRTEDLSVSIEVEGMEIRVDDAEVRITQTMQFRLARTGEQRDSDLELRMLFARTEVGWRLERVER